MAMTINYDALCAEAKSLVEGVDHPIANLANLSALIFQSLEELNWAGFYLLEDGKLVLGPFQGNLACVEIPFGKGVCGTAAALDETQLVPDVHAFPGHIACDSASRSEIVVPIRSGGKVVGVLDIDSPIRDRFTEDDREGLEALARAVEKEMFG